MSLTGVSGQSPSLLPFPTLQEAAGNATNSPATGIDPDGDNDGKGSVQATGDGSKGISSSGSLLQQLQAAILQSLQHIDPSQSNNPQDIFKTIEQTFKSVLQQNGIDPNQITAGGTNGSTSLVDSVLAQNNVEPQQFRSNLLQAITSAQNGSIDPSQIFQGFPSGQSFNALA